MGRSHKPSCSWRTKFSCPPQSVPCIERVTSRVGHGEVRDPAAREGTEESKGQFGPRSQASLTSHPFPTSGKKKKKKSVFSLPDLPQFCSLRAKFSGRMRNTEICSSPGNEWQIFGLSSSPHRQEFSPHSPCLRHRALRV